MFYHLRAKPTALLDFKLNRFWNWILLSWIESNLFLSFLRGRQTLFGTLEVLIQVKSSSVVGHSLEGIIISRNKSLQKDKVNVNKVGRNAAQIFAF